MTTPINHPSCFDRSILSRPTVFTRELTGQELEELTFPQADASHLLTLQHDLKNSLETIGFVVLKGFSHFDLKGALVDQAFLHLGALIGKTLPQNTRGDLLYSVTDEGTQAGSPTQRGAKSNSFLDFHTDCAPHWQNVTADYIALCAVRPGRRGGETILVSASTVYNEMSRHFPSYVSRFFQPYCFDRRAELRLGDEEVFRAPIMQRIDDAIQMRYAAVYIFRGHEVAREPLSANELVGLNLLTVTLHREELQVRLKLEEGDVLLANNSLTAHARAYYEDDADPTKKRLLLRQWLAKESRW